MFIILGAAVIITIIIIGIIIALIRSFPKVCLTIIGILVVMAILFNFTSLDADEFTANLLKGIKAIGNWLGDRM